MGTVAEQAGVAGPSSSSSNVAAGRKAEQSRETAGDQQHQRGDTRSEVSLGPVWVALLAAVSLGVWMTLFVCGTFVNASELIGVALDNGMTGQGVWSFTAGVLCWTWTNLLMLCVASASLGGIARSWDSPDSTYSKLHFDALTTGFVIFMLFLFEESLTNGNVINGGQPADAQAKYLRLVIVTSLLSFVASYRPEFHKRLLAGFAAGQGTGTDSVGASGQPVLRPDAVVSSTPDQSDSDKLEFDKRFDS
ncbi:MAG: hypothetical protein NXI04_25265 [Planctomycetaceae bacterium]|nr:hypothetical protein [Planctomycetaceae bacterium]